MLPRGGILPGRVLGRALIHRGEGGDGGLDHGVGVNAGGGHGQQTHGGQHAEAAAHVVGNDEGLPAGLVGHALENAAVRVRGGDDALGRLLGAVLGLEQAAEHAEGEGGLERRAGFGDHVDLKILLAQLFEQALQGVGGHGVAREDDLRVARARTGTQQLDRALRAEIGAADADHDQHLAAAADAVGSRNDLLELLILHALGQTQPPGKVRAEAGALGERAVRGSSGGIVRSGGVKKRFRAGEIHFQHK